ncbi:MAG TPA: PSD1 and planctomycete cytochrome C domain-containing protein [Verrucomicrobiae bacterium]|nr:PSD1 and planctomycete cytochrome C domain-containing protein [Verrucomicrobiae bacterium]
MLKAGRRNKWIRRAGAVLALAGAAHAHAAEPDAAGVEFFEKQVRPLLADHCYQCHSEKSEKVKGGLKLDTRENLLKGGENGPSIVPGEPDKSLLIKAVRYTDENLQMPPKKEQRLTAGQVATLEHWVRMGAPVPRVKSDATVASAPAKPAQPHWAFQPVKLPPTPPVKNTRWSHNPVDSFVLAKLEEKGLTPSPRADRRTLIRRATFDLTGMPPTAAEVEAFVRDRSPDAYARLIDKLLASPRYGERWGRRWLDIARYADTKGYVFEEERRYAYSYTYRDYVIRAFNEDLPYDRFLQEQIAADLLDLGDDKRPLAALGFLTLGRRFLNQQPDIIDDRIDVVTRGTMALTVVCARCHDHKFDPIPTADYYSLYGVFASCHEPSEEPLLGTTPPEYDAYLKEHQNRVEERDNFRAKANADLWKKLRESVGDYLLAAHDASAIEEGKRDALARERKLDPGTVRRWMNALESWQKETNVIFMPWIKFAAIPEKEFDEKAPAIAKEAAGPATHPQVAELFAGEPPKSLKEVAERYQHLFKDVEEKWRQLVKNAGTNAAPKGFDDQRTEFLRQVLYADGAPANLPVGELPRLYDVPTAQKSRALQRKVEELDATHPGAPPRAMALLDNSSPVEPHIFKRGNPGNVGAKVPRQFLEIVAGPARKPFTQGSGRLELAKAITSKDNPLTARVMMNRMWLYHFGTALVRTTGDFGVRCEPPTHPELLDYLASKFMENGWSVKKMHRLLMLSEAYQQTSDERPRAAQVDPANQLYWRMNRRRLDFESMRDSLLAVSGRLDPAMGGRAVEITAQPSPPRRTIYGFVERQNLPGLFRTFDFASPDTTMSQRFTTTVPQQALFLMNSPFVAEQARSLASRSDIQALKQDSQRVQALFETAYQRKPDRDELRMALDYIHEKPLPAIEPPAPPVWSYGWGEFDEKSKRVVKFEKLPAFVNDAWQGGQKLPDDKLGWVTLNATGGHPGENPGHMAIRRWTAPKDGVVSVRGTLKHESKEGDGVRGRIVSSRAGALGEWSVHDGKETTNLEKVEVQKGETLDFVVDCRMNVGFDSFTWAPTVKTVAVENKSMSSLTGEWNAKADFSGPPKEADKPLNAWERYAQALLVANEFFFVD